LKTILLDREELQKKEIIPVDSRYLAILSKSQFYKMLVALSFVSNELKRGEKGAIITPKRTIPVEVLIEKFSNTEEQLSRLFIFSLTDFNKELAFFKKLPPFLAHNRIRFLFFEEPLENYYYNISKEGMDEEKFRNNTKMLLWERALLKELSQKNNLIIFEAYENREQGLLKAEQTTLKNLLKIWPDIIIEIDGENYLNFLYGNKSSKFKLVFKESGGRIEIEKEV
jgi:hypothetical protein